MKHIVMATDLSARSDRALERAFHLASDRGDDLTILHVVDEGLPTSLVDLQRQAAEKAVQEQLDTFAADSRPSVATEVVAGRAHVDIVRLAERVGAGLIVLGVHRENTFKDMFRGTTAERVIRTADIPVLLVREPVAGDYRRIMVGVDFSVYSRRAVEFAIRFVPSGEFHLVHAYDVPFGAFLYGQDTRRQVTQEHQSQFQQMIEQEMAAFLSTFDGDAADIKCVMQEGAALEVIHRQAQELKPDVLVIGTHGRTGVAHAIFGSVAEDLLRQPPCDVIAVKAW